MTALRHHDWPGNVRALRHAVERAVILSGGQPLQPHDFPIGATASRLRPEAVVAPSSPHDLNLDRAERRLVRSEEHTSELQSLMRIPHAVFGLKKKKKQQPT